MRSEGSRFSPLFRQDEIRGQGLFLINAEFDGYSLIGIQLFVFADEIGGKAGGMQIQRDVFFLKAAGGEIFLGGGEQGIVVGL